MLKKRFYNSFRYNNKNPSSLFVFLFKIRLYQYKHLFKVIEISKHIDNIQMERKKTPAAFIRNTYQILQREDLFEIISWADDGYGFIIRNIQKFEAEILPQYFKHKKYTSFVRQLNMYGFHKQRHSSNQNYFRHESFKKGEMLLADIKRKPEKKKTGSNDQQQLKEEYSSQANIFGQGIDSKTVENYDINQITQLSYLLIQQNKMLMNLNTPLRDQALNSKQRKIHIYLSKGKQLIDQKSCIRNNTPQNSQRPNSLLQIQVMQQKDKQISYQLIQVLRGQIQKMERLSQSTYSI